MFIKLKPEAIIPQYQTIKSAGVDLHYCGPDKTLGPKGEFGMFGTGLQFINNMPNTELQIRPRSGLAAKHGITVLNSPGTIDADYTGEILVILINHSMVRFTIRNGDRIAQAVINPIIIDQDLVINQERQGGIGSTGC